MLESSVDLSSTLGNRPAWRTFAGKRVTIHALTGSYAARRAPLKLREAESVVTALEDLLRPPTDKRRQPVDIYLTDPVADLPASLGGEQRTEVTDRQAARDPNALVSVMQPEASGEPLAGPLTRLLVARWIGPTALQATTFLIGIAGVIESRLGVGPTVADAEDWVREEVAARRPVSIFAATAGTTDPPTAATTRIATAFVAYLLQTFDPALLRQFLATYDPDRRDQAALATYNRPLGALEESWLGSLRKRATANAAFRAFMQSLLSLLRPYGWRQAETLGYMLIGLGYNLVLPLATKFLIDTIIPSGSINNLLLFIGGLLVIYVLNALLGLRRAYVTNWITQRILIDLQARMFTHLQRLAHDYYSKAKTGDIMARLSSDLNTVQQAMGLLVGSGLFMALNAVVVAITILLLSPVLGLVVLLVVPLFVFTYYALRARLQKASLAVGNLTGETAGLAQENLAAHGVIKALSLENRAIGIYQARLQLLFKAMLQLVVTSSLFEASTGLAVTLGQLVVFGVGGFLVINSNISIGTLLAFVGLLPSLFTPISVLSSISQAVQRASGGLERVNALLNAPISITDPAAAHDLPPLAQEIRLENVTFSYDPDHVILHDLSLRIPAGSHVAIVGPSGSGKSTIINLLLRFWDPEAGQVCFDGQDIRTVTLTSLRQQIGIVFQDTFVFDTTVRENIALARLGASDTEVVAAATAARLTSFIEALPAGYDTVLGERGVRMSGGQRQRLAIARALLRQPHVLILDEATSALDAQTEREILDTLVTVTQGRTTISITHRLALAAAADLVLVLENGQLVEQGPHSQLIQTGGLYQRLYEEQTGHGRGGPQQRAEVEMARLREIPLFAGLQADAMVALTAQLQMERYAAGDDIVRQGEPGDKLYIINHGQADVVVDTRRVNTLNAGDYFGEMALLVGEPRSATVRATMSTEVYSLAQTDFESLLTSVPALRQAVSETVTARRTAVAEAGTEPAAA